MSLRRGGGRMPPVGYSLDGDGGFRRSSRFGVIGLLVVVALVVAIALGTGSGEEANPKLTLGLIFGVIALYMAILFVLQRADIDRAATSSARGTERAAAEGAREIDDPTTMSEPELWAALAVRPIGPEAVKARAQAWESSRSSLRLGVIVTVLIFLTVPSIYLLESFIPLLIGGPLIVIAALYGSFRAMTPGGDVDRGYELAGVAMEPLGLEIVERPRIDIEMRDSVTPRMGPRIDGDVVMKGRRHGRQVTVRLGSGEVRSTSEVTVAVPAAEYEARSRKVAISGGPEGIVVARRGGGRSDWLCDLWLAERLAG